MMTTRRRLLAYAKADNHTTFTPAQRRRMVAKARKAGRVALKSGWANQDLMDAIAVRAAAKAGPEHLQDVVTLIMSYEPS